MLLWACASVPSSPDGLQPANFVCVPAYIVPVLKLDRWPDPTILYTMRVIPDRPNVSVEAEERLFCNRNLDQSR